MKKILEFVFNFLLFILYTTQGLFGVLWYGSLPKISIYHRQLFPFDFADIFNKKFKQSQIYPARLRARDFIDSLNEEEYGGEMTEFLTTEIPIYENHEKVGSQTVYSVLVDKLGNWEKNSEKIEND